MVIEARKPFEVIAAGESILKNSGAEFRHGGTEPITRALATTSNCRTVDSPAYYATGCHELVHWSGNEKRLNRDTLNKSRACSHDDEHYAREELVAEIGSMMLAAETGLPHYPAQHAAYVASWLEALRKDKNEIFSAASAASRATDYVLGRGREVSPKSPAEDSQVARLQRSSAVLTR